MPFFKNAGSFASARYVLGGWQLSGVLIMDSGTLVSVTNGAAFRLSRDRQTNLGGDCNADNSGGDRPNAPSTPVKSAGFSREQFLTGMVPANVFTAPAPGTDGNLGRNTFRGPGFAQTDLASAEVRQPDRLLTRAAQQVP